MRRPLPRWPGPMPFPPRPPRRAGVRSYRRLRGSHGNAGALRRGVRRAGRDAGKGQHVADQRRGLRRPTMPRCHGKRRHERIREYPAATGPGEGYRNRG